MLDAWQRAMMYWPKAWPRPARSSYPYATSLLRPPDSMCNVTGESRPAAAARSGLLVRTGGESGPKFRVGMAERTVRDLAEGWSDAAIADRPDFDQPPRRRPVFRRPNRQNQPSPESSGGSQMRRPRRKAAIFRGLKRLWIPLAIAVVVIAGAVTVSRLHGLFGTEKRLSYGDTRIDSTKPFAPKHLTYEVFGAPGTVAEISYIDINGDPQLVTGVTLPWTLDVTVTPSASVGNLMAQGDSDSIGCRIVLDGVVKAENTTNQEQAFTSCSPKAA